MWLWGLGGLAGSFAVGPLIDRMKRVAWLLTVILFALSLSLVAIPSLVHIGWIALAAFFVWGAMGWSSLAPQQHAVLAISPEHGPAAVALNSSCNYLGGAVGTLAAGALIYGGLSPAALPWWAAAAVFAALLCHLLKTRLFR